MRIFVFGNINSGKTSLSLRLKRFFPDYSYLAIDEYRRRYGDGTLEGELKAVSSFVHDCLRYSNSIIEFSGCGSVAEALKKELPRCSGIMLICSRSSEDCIKSISSEKYAEIPYPQEFQKVESLADTIRRLEPATTEDALLNQWQPYVWQSYTIPFLAAEPDIFRVVSFEHHQFVELVRDFALKNKLVDELVIYGSMGANSLTQDSDLDFYMRTHIKPQALRLLLEDYFKNHIVHSDLLRNKITLRMKSALLIEVVCGAELDETALYYRESQIDRPEITVLKGDDRTVEILKGFLEKRTSIVKMVSPIVAEIYFLLCSLPKLVHACDSYKYAFHVAIMQHYAVQLESLLAGCFKHNYLPKHAASALPDFPWNYFASSPTGIEQKQYRKLYGYLRDLFYRLEMKNLINAGQYFSQQGECLHRLRNSDILDEEQRSWRHQKKRVAKPGSGFDS